MNQETLRKQLLYNPATGEFFWLTKRNYGKKAGHLSSPGYIQITLNKKTYRAHRLAFLWMTGETPKLVDHKNRVCSDNRWSNLREATETENLANSENFKNNRSGYKNITWNPKYSSWRCEIQCRGLLHCKNMKDLQKLILWRDTKRTELFGEFS